MKQIWFNDKIKAGTKVEFDGAQYAVHACVDLNWLTKGEVQGYNLVLKPLVKVAVSTKAPESFWLYDIFKH